MKIRKAIIPAAGLGTRFLPVTKTIPKEMLPIIDKPTIQYIVEEAVASGIEEIIIITGKGKNAIEDYFDRAYMLENNLLRKGKLDLLKKVQITSQLVDLYYIRQQEPMGLGHAIWCARKLLDDEPFAVLLGDTFIDSQTPCLQQMIEHFECFGASMIGVQTVAPDKVMNYGIVDAQKLNDMIYKINQLVEKPELNEAPSNLAIIGRYILTPDIFNILEKQELGQGNEIQLTDALAKLNGHKPVYACEIRGAWYDIGEPLGYVKALLAQSCQREDWKKEITQYLHYLLHR